MSKIIGKSSCYESFKKIINDKYQDSVNLFYVSSDKIQGELINEHLNKYPHASRDDAFNAIKKKAGNYYDNQICKL